MMSTTYLFAIGMRDRPRNKREQCVQLRRETLRPRRTVFESVRLEPRKSRIRIQFGDFVRSLRSCSAHPILYDSFCCASLICDADKLFVLRISLLQDSLYQHSLIRVSACNAASITDEDC